MPALSKYRVLIAGILSPLAAVFLYTLVAVTLARFSSDLEKDWLLRLSASTLAMAVPFLITLFFAMRDRRQHSLTWSAKLGLVLAFLSLGLAWKPVNDGIRR